MGDSDQSRLLGTVMPPPTPADQIQFLQQIQRILQEGSFVASYKFALLHSIADLCVRKGDDSGDPLTLSTTELAEGFVELYWRQTAPYPASEPSVLHQNTGRQAAIVSRISEARQSYGGSLARFQEREGEWKRLLREIERTVCVMPLWRLQTIGNEDVEFLYENRRRGRSITLKEGVAYCFRAFYPMLSEMLEGAWAQFVRRQNRQLLGSRADLRSFLFGTDRSALSRFRPILHEVQEGSCFYCSRRVPAESDVDHFIPWRRYPTDLGHNFVLAHRGCNNAKRDQLAAERHLARWRERNELRSDELAARFDATNILHDLGASLHVARWAYGQAYRAGGHAWLEGDQLEPLSGAWAEILT
jgi:5-methylcytosine-specific restriction endonuclease McrA